MTDLSEAPRAQGVNSAHGDATTRLGGAAEAGIATEYWNSLIGEREAASFLGLTDRSMQQFRQGGGGPQYVVISARCIRYRRADIKAWADARLRSSTADPGPDAQPQPATA